MSGKTCAVLVVAAGRGRRFGGETPKQYSLLAGQPVVRHSLAQFMAHPAISQVITVIHPEDQADYDAATAGLLLPDSVFGGAERQESVRLGLEHLATGPTPPPDLVLIHDAARPLVPWAVINRLLESLDHAAGAIPGLPVVDTLKRADHAGAITATLPREGLWRAQTPQGFHFAPCLAAHRAAAGQSLTDDAAVLEAAGEQVVMVPGSEASLKLTTRHDLETLDRLLAQRPLEERTGHGIDVHAFAEGGEASSGHLTLCGVAIPHPRPLSGHSDADVAFHALTDALYGAIGAGDIGRVFPPSNPRWKGADSALFLRHAAALVRALGGTIVHVDVTLVCESPKIGPHRAAMAASVGRCLELAPERVSVKATTSERLGFTGRREGIAAHATATLRFPAPLG